MNDNDYEGMTQEYARIIHQHIAIERNKEILPLRLRTITAALLSDMVPLAVRIQILTSLTYACASSEGVSPMDAAKDMVFFKELLLGEKGDTLAKGMLNDGVVQKVLATSQRHKARTMERVQAKLEEEAEMEKNKVVDLHSRKGDGDPP